MSATLTTETASFVTIEPLLQRLRERGIKIPRPDEVRDYLTDYPIMRVIATDWFRDIAATITL